MPYKNPETRLQYNRDYSKLNAWRRPLKEFGLGEDEFNRLIEKGCAICGEPFQVRKGRTRSDSRQGIPHFDHDHITGRFRGLLCCQCNVGVGMLKDSPAILLRAAEYLGRKET